MPKRKARRNRAVEATGTNIFVLSEMDKRLKAGETIHHVDQVDLPHVRRCIAAGLATVSQDHGLRITPTGHAAIRERADRPVRGLPFKRNSGLTVDQWRDMLTEEIEDWRDEDPHALNDLRFWALIGKDAGVDFTVTGKALHTVHEEGWDEAHVTRYDLSKTKDRDHIASELLKQVEYASPAQVKKYMDHRDKLFEEV